MVPFAKRIANERGRVSAVPGEGEVEFGKVDSERGGKGLPFASCPPACGIWIDDDKSGHAASRVSNDGASEAISAVVRSSVQPSSPAISIAVFSRTAGGGGPNW